MSPWRIALYLWIAELINDAIHCIPDISQSCVTSESMNDCIVSLDISIHAWFHCICNYLNPCMFASCLISEFMCDYIVSVNIWIYILLHWIWCLNLCVIALYARIAKFMHNWIVFQDIWIHVWLHCIPGYLNLCMIALYPWIFESTHDYIVSVNTWIQVWLHCVWCLNLCDFILSLDIWIRVWLHCICGHLNPATIAFFPGVHQWLDLIPDISQSMIDCVVCLTVWAISERNIVLITLHSWTSQYLKTGRLWNFKSIH